jgi:hypothetical protein
MNTRGLARQTLSIVLIACAAISLLLAACLPASAPAETAETSATLPATLPAALPAATQVQAAEATLAPTQPAPTEAAQPPAALSGEVTLSLGDLAQATALETVPAVAPGSNAISGVMPEYKRLTLQGYPVANHHYQPQISIYPLADLAQYNQAARDAATALQALLLNQQPGAEMPFLPLINAKQVFHGQVQFLGFKGGQGVRYITWYSQGLVRVSSEELIYTYQGLTSDSRYYISVVLPLTHPELPDKSGPYAENEEMLKGYLPYLQNTADLLNQQPGDSFGPSLAKLDALVQSIEVK